MRTKRWRLAGCSTHRQSSAAPELVRLGPRNVDLTSWHLPSLADCDEDFSRKVLEAASEAISLSIEGATIAFLRPEGRAEEGENKCVDPTLMSLELPLGINDMENPIWIFSLSHVVQSVLTTTVAAGKYSPNNRDRLLRRIRDGLIGLVLQIDQALNKVP